MNQTIVLAASLPSIILDRVPVCGLARRHPYYLIVLVWIYCVIWFLIQDLVKVSVYAILKKYPLPSIKSETGGTLPDQLSSQ